LLGENQRRRFFGVEVVESRGFHDIVGEQAVGLACGQTFDR
jgi:hypothetical protein